MKISRFLLCLFLVFCLVGCGSDPKDTKPLNLNDVPAKTHMVFRESFVVVMSKNSTASGFTVGPRLVLTAGHVVNSAKDKELMISWRGSFWQTKIVAWTWNEDLDLALLEVIDKDGTFLSKPVIINDEDFSLLEETKSYSFKLITKSEETKSHGIRLIESGRPLFVKHGKFIGRHRVLVEERQRNMYFLNGSVIGGFSGGPILDEDGYCRGVVVVSGDHPISGTGFIPSRDVIKFLKMNGVWPLVHYPDILIKLRQ